MSIDVDFFMGETNQVEEKLVSGRIGEKMNWHGKERQEDTGLVNECSVVGHGEC